MNPTLSNTGAWPVGAPHAKLGFRAPALLANVLVPLGALLCDYLFYLEKPGFNFLVYIVFILAVQLTQLPRHAALWRAPALWVGLAGSCVSAGLVGWYGSTLAVLASIVSVLLVLGVLNQPVLRQLTYALLTALGSALQASAAIWAVWRHPEKASAKRVQLSRGWFYARLLGVPLLMLVVFHLLFSVANPVYYRLSSRFFELLGEWLSRLLPSISVPHLLFLALCFIATAGALVVVPTYYFADHESHFGEFIRRQRDRVASFGVRRPDFRSRTFRSLDLRKEYYVALAVFALLNALLLVVNAIDVKTLWFGFQPAPGFDLTQFVHEGTYVLIFSILLAAGIMLWFFRRNLNFYGPGLPWLRWGATLWVVQNAVLAVSVGLRNYYYITYTELAYKRIGVCFFLVLTLFGLATVLLKIWQQRSAFSLIRLNTWAAYVVLLLLASGNWEIWIARYNLQTRFSTIDIGFLLNMPPRVLPVLLERQAVLTHAAELVVDNGYGTYERISLTDVRAALQRKVTSFQRHYQEHGNWQSRNVSEWQTKKQLERLSAARSLDNTTLK